MAEGLLSDAAVNQIVEALGQTDWAQWARWKMIEESNNPEHSEPIRYVYRPPHFCETGERWCANEPGGVDCECSHRYHRGAERVDRHSRHHAQRAASERVEDFSRLFSLIRNHAEREGLSWDAAAADLRINPRLLNRRPA